MGTLSPCASSPYARLRNRAPSPYAHLRISARAHLRLLRTRASTPPCSMRSCAIRWLCICATRATCAATLPACHAHPRTRATVVSCASRKKGCRALRHSPLHSPVHHVPRPSDAPLLRTCAIEIASPLMSGYCLVQFRHVTRNGRLPCRSHSTARCVPHRYYGAREDVHVCAFTFSVLFALFVRLQEMWCVARYFGTSILIRKTRTMDTSQRTIWPRATSCSILSFSSSCVEFLGVGTFRDIE